MTDRVIGKTAGILRWTLAALVVLSSVCRLDAQSNTSKTAGASFRVDDQHDATAWAGFAGAFDKYGFKFTYAANLNLLPMDVNAMRSLNTSGHEMADHTSDHSTFYFTDTDIKKYKGLPGIDHVTPGLNRVCLTIDRIDTLNSTGELTLNIRNGCGYCPGSGGIAKSVASYPVLGLYSPERHWFFRIADSQTSASSPDSASMLVLVNPWGEPLAISDADSVRFRLIHFFDVSMSDDGLALLAKRTVDLSAKYGFAAPTSWVQPGGSSPYLPAQQLKRVWGAYGYTSAATYPNASLKCFSEYNPLYCTQFAMENDFDLDSADLSTCETMIANSTALNSVSIGVSHLSSSSSKARPGEWQAFLKKVDDLLAWCKRKNIPVKTHREWAKLLYDIPQNPYVNVFPRLDVDLDEDGVPDGFIKKSGDLVANDGVDASGGKSYSIARPGTLCTIQGLGGLEKGMNVFSICTKGGAGDSVEVIFTLHSAIDVAIHYTFPATTSDWRKHDTTVTILDDVSLCDVEIRAARVGAKAAKISGMTLSKVPDPIALNVYTIKAGAGDGGTITPSGTFRVSYGISQTFRITPNAGYQTVDVVLDSVSAGPLSTELLSSISSNHTLVASFRQTKKPVVGSIALTNVTPASAVLSGSINPSGLPTTYSLQFGINTSYGFTYPIQSLPTGNIPVSINRTLEYLSPGTTYHCRLVATNSDGSTYGNDVVFTTALEAYAITASAGTNGEIRPARTVMVAFGDDQAFTIDPNDGYRIDSVLVDNVSIGDTTNYTFRNINSEHKIRATFRRVDLVTAVKHPSENLPAAFALSQNYPNPFNPSTTISYQISAVSVVTVQVVDVLGKEVATIVNGRREAGVYTVRWNAGNAPSGMYFYRLQARPIEAGQVGEFVETRKMILLR